MIVLPAGKPLRKFLPAADDLLYDPSTFLGEGSLAIGPRRVSGLAALFGAAGALCLVACAATGRWHDEKLLIGIGLLLGSAVWVGWSFRLRGHELVLHPDGIEVLYRDTVVWCPWALFNTEGALSIPNRDDPRVGLILPVWPQAVPYTVLRRDGTPVGHGTEISTPQLRFTSRDEVILPALYEVAAGDLGALLLQLGNRLGRRLPANVPPPSSYPRSDQQLQNNDTSDEKRWIRLPLSRLRFPQRCSRCGHDTEDTLRYHLDVNPVRDRLTGTQRPFEISVPFCQSCREQLTTSRGKSGAVGLLIGAACGSAVGAGLAAAQQGIGPASFLVSGIAGLAFGALAGFLAGTGLFRGDPVRFRRYLPTHGTVEIRFQNPDYTSAVAEATRSGRSPD